MISVVGKRGKNVIRLCFSYFAVILVCTVGISALSCKYIMNNTQRHIIESNAKLLDQFKKTIDEFVLRNIDKISLTVFSNDDDYNLMYYLTQPLESNVSSISRIYDKLQAMRNISPFVVDSIAVYSQKSNIVISTDGMKYITQQPDNDWVDTGWVKVLENMGDSKYNWIGTRKIKNQNYASVQDKNIVTFVRKFVNSNSLYGMAISIKEDVLCGIIEDSAPIDFGQMFIVGEDGTILSHNNKDYIYRNIASIFNRQDAVRILGTSEKNGYYMLEINGKRSVVSYATSKYNNWKYIFIKPVDRFVEGFEFIRQVVLIISILFAVMVAVIVLYSLGKFYIPLIRLADESKKTIDNIKCFDEKDCVSSMNNEYQIVCSTLGLLSDKIKQQEKDMEEDIPVLKHYIISNLIVQHYQNIEDLHNRLKYIKVDFNHEYYGVLYIKVNSMAAILKDAYTLKGHIAECIEKIMSQHGILSICSYNENDIIILYNSEYLTCNCIDALMDISGFVGEKYGLHTTAAAGGIYKGIRNVHKSYRDIRKCISYLYTCPDRNYISIEDVNSWELDFHSIAADFTEDFYNNFKLRNQEMTLKSAGLLINEMVKKHYSYDHVMMFTDRVIAFLEGESSVLNINHENDYSVNIFTDLKQAEHIYALQEKLCNIIKEFFLFIENRCSRRNRELVEKAKEIITGNIKNEFISLNMVSNALFISPNHLSKIFKEETGMNFIDFVIDCRLEASLNMLVSTNLRIEEISNAVGYINCQYFIKKFKLKYGITPKNYRMLHVV